MRRTRGAAGFTLVELLVCVAIVAVLATISFTVMGSMRARANQQHATERLRSISSAFGSYTADNGGLLPWEDCPGTDDWNNASKPENVDVWYNALPKLMGSEPVGELAARPKEFYAQTYPLYIRGAGYPGESKRLEKPFFALAMNSRLQRKADDDESALKVRGKFHAILNPGRTVLFFERGLPNDKKTIPAQAGYDGAPKGNPRNFAARYNQKGMLVFADGHIEMFQASDLMNAGGQIKVPQDRIVWTCDPDDDPN
jgi:prepilin-type N-terminal cleavage/methylation domain-containing protein